VKVSEVMTAQVVSAKPTDHIHAVALLMSQIDTGVIPVLDDGKVVGVITDRDIVLRVVAEKGDLHTPVSEIMTTDVQSCSEEATVADAAGKMAKLQIRRLIVLNEGGKLAGIVSLGDIAVDFGAKAVGHTLEEISEAPASH
jgi:CBS domain-containing protein